MSPYILSCMLAASLNPAQHPMPNECERAYVSLDRCKKAQLAIAGKWTPVCYTPSPPASASRACPADASGDQEKWLWIGRDFVWREYSAE